MNPSGVWNFVNQKRGTSRIPSYMTDEKHIEFTDPQKIVDTFAKTFSSVYTNNRAPSFTTSNGIYSSFSVTSVSPEELILIMGKFSNKLTAGDDLIPSFIIHDCRHILATPLALIINLALKTNTYPDRWKIAKVIPILKKGSSQMFNNYRPISILPNFSKVMEQVLYKQIYRNVHPYLSPNQHGFLKGRSTITNLAVLYQRSSEEIDKRSQVERYLHRLY